METTLAETFTQTAPGPILSPRIWASLLGSAFLEGTKKTTTILESGAPPIL